MWEGLLWHYKKYNTGVTVLALFLKCITPSVGWYPIWYTCINSFKLKYCLLSSVELSVDTYSTSSLLNDTMIIYCTVNQLHDNHESSNDLRPTKMICLQVICNYQQSTYDGNEQNHHLKRLKIKKQENASRKGTQLNILCYFITSFDVWGLYADTFFSITYVYGFMELHMP